MTETEELKQYKTCELVNELEHREGVEKIMVEPHKIKEIKIEGPTIILKVTD